MLKDIEQAKIKVEELSAAEDFDPEAPTEEYLKWEGLEKLKASCVELATAQIYMMIAFGLNACLMMVFARTVKATDKEWFRIRIYNFIAIGFQCVSGFINLSRMATQFDLDDTEKCQEGWIGVSLALQSLFIVALILNVVSVGLVRIELVNRIRRYFYYREEPDIAIKYWLGKEFNLLIYNFLYTDYFHLTFNF